MWWTAERERVYVHATASARRWEENWYHQLNSDSWFMGFTPTLSQAYGLEARKDTFTSTPWLSDRGAGRAPIYGLFMQKVYADP